MGRQRGIVHLSGQFGDTQLALDGKKGISKFHTPVSKEQIMNDPAYDLLRKQMAEFTGASRGLDSLVKCLGPNAKAFGDRYLRSRFQTKLHSILKRGTGVNGERSFDASQHRELLENLDLNLKDKLKTRFPVDFVVDVNADRNSATLTVPSFDTRHELNAPRGATHFRIRFSVGALSDFAHTGHEEVYTATQPALNGKYDRQYTALMPIDGLANAGFQMVASLLGSPVLPVDMTLVCAVGVEFFKVVNGHPDILAQGNALQLVKAA